jgi:hypothetical protein
MADIICNIDKYANMASELMHALATARQGGGIRSHQHDEQRSRRRKKHSTPAPHTCTHTHTHQTHTHAAPAYHAYFPQTPARAAGRGGGHECAPATRLARSHAGTAARRLRRRHADAAAAGLCVCISSSSSNSSTWQAAAPRPLLGDRVGYQAARECPDMPELKHARALTKPLNHTSRCSRWIPNRSLPPQ